MSDISTTRIFTDGERGITAQKLNDIVGSSVIQPAFYTSKPTAGSADPADIALILKAGAYAQVPISALAGSATQAQIWSTRLRSYNAVGNPTFEADQISIGSSFVIGTANARIDRWSPRKNGTMAGTAQRVAATGGDVLVPGTNFCISNRYLRITLTTQQASLLAGDYMDVTQSLEGPQIRELFYDVTSVSLLVRSSVAGLKFGFYLKDPTGANTLTKLCTIPTANSWTLISLANLPIFPGAGTWTTNTGVVGAIIGICLGSGATFASPANDVFQSGNFLSATGQSNYAASPVNSTFDIAFVQHEPGGVCSTLMDKPFTQNLDECLRYYQKTYRYGAAIGTADNIASVQTLNITTTASLNVGQRFKKSLAKSPIVTAYNVTTGVANTANNRQNGAVVNVTGFTTPNSDDIGALVGTGGTLTVNDTLQFHYTADTGW